MLVDADDFHPEANVAKMAAGVPLTDADRQPWIARLAEEIRRRAAQGERVVLACSALRRAHRAQLSSAADDVVVVHLEVSDAVLARRLTGRRDHFMPVDLLRSQLDDLEHPGPDRAVVVDGDAPVADVVDEVVRRAAR